MVDEYLQGAGLVPDIDDVTLGGAYEACPAVERSLIKNCISFTYALHQTGREVQSVSERFSHVGRTVNSDRLDWAFFAVDERIFPLPAVFSAMVLALVAKVETLVVYVRGPLSRSFLVGCDLLSIQQIYTSRAEQLVSTLEHVGRGVVVDLAGLELSPTMMIRPRPENYGVAVDLPENEFVAAYRTLTEHFVPTARHTYLCYGGKEGSAPVIMADQFLGCWQWDSISYDSFRAVSTIFS